MKLLPDTLQKVYQRLCRIQDLINDNQKITHAVLLNEIFPAVSDCYSFARNSENGVLKQYETIAFGFGAIESFTDIISPAAAEELQNYTMDNQRITCGRTETVLEAAIKFINIFDYSLIKKDDDLQKIIIDKIIVNFFFLQTYVFNNAKMLTDEHLTSLAEARNKIKSVKLINCDRIDGSGLIAVVYHNSDVQICLDGFESISVFNLLYLVQQCQDLTLVFDKKTYKVKENKIPADLFNHALQNEYMTIITVALLSGAHLNCGDGYQSPLHIATQQGKFAVIEELIRYGASLDVLNDEGKSPLDIALAAFLDAKIKLFEQQVYKKIIGQLICHGALDVKNVTAILELFKNVNPSLEFLTFARYNKLLSADTIWLVPNYVTELDLSSSKNKYHAVTLSIELINALRERLPNLKILNIQGCIGLTMPIYFKILGWKLDIIIMDFNQSVHCGLAKIKELDRAAQLYSNKVIIHITSLVLTKQIIDELRSLDESLFGALDCGPMISRFESQNRGIKRMNRRETYDPEIANSYTITKQEVKRFEKLQIFICNNNNLKKLELLHCNLVDDEVKYLAKALKENVNLESFSLKGNSLSDKGVKILLEALSTQKNLRELFIIETQAGLESAKALGKIIINHPHLEILSVVKSPLGDNGVEELAQAMQLSAACLKKLELNELGMTESSAYILSKSLIFFKTLFFLDIAYNPLGDIGSEYFLELLQLNTGLTEIKCAQINSDIFWQKLLEQAAKNLQNKQKSTLNTLAQKYQSQDQQCVQSLLPSQYWESKHFRQQNIKPKHFAFPLELPSLLMPNSPPKQDNYNESNTKSTSWIRNSGNRQNSPFFNRIPSANTTIPTLTPTQTNPETQNKDKCFGTSDGPN